MTKINEKKNDLIKEILDSMNDEYGNNTLVYRSAKQGLEKLAHYELSSIYLMIETAKLAKAKDD